MSNNSYFNRIAHDYHKSADVMQPMYDEIARTLNDLVRNKAVLDVGNGSRFGYDPAIATVITALDVSAAMLEKIEGANVTKVVDDARAMTGISDASMDVAVFQLVLHHITGDTPRGTVAVLEDVLRSAWKKLRNGGHLVIIETLLPPPLYLAEFLLFSVTRAILARSGVSMIYFFSRRVLTRAIERATGTRSDTVTIVPITLSGWFDPLAGSFPGRVKIPSWASPTRLRLFVITKDAA